LKKTKKALWLIAPDDWDPKPGETVTWSQTGEIRLEVLAYDFDAEVAVVRGTIFGVMEEYKAPRIELAPVARQLESAEEDEGWADDPYEEKSLDTPEPPEPAGVVSVEHDDLIARLTFSASRCRGSSNETESLPVQGDCLSRSGVGLRLLLAWGRIDRCSGSMSG